MGKLTVYVDVHGLPHGVVPDGLVLRLAGEGGLEVPPREAEADLVAAGPGPVRLLERASLACGERDTLSA